MSLENEIKKSVWYNKKSIGPNVKKWLKNTKKPKGFIPLRAGTLVYFYYDTPKYEETLDFFDSSPLVFVFGQIKTQFGIRDIGLNLHLYPKKWRYKIISEISKIYSDEIKSKQIKSISTKKIVNLLKPIGIEFGLRMYIPQLRKYNIEFEQDEWVKAIFIESKQIRKISLKELELKWKKFKRNVRK